MNRRWRFGPLLLATLLAAMLAIGAVGCGDDDSADAPAADPPAATTEAPATTAPETTGGAAATVLEIPAAEQGLAYDKTEATAPAGEVTLSMPNPSPIPHNIAVEQPEEAIGEIVEQGGVSEITVDFPAGDYEYFCTVPGHREAGMVGTLTVE